jgi:hypothetical protein
MSATSLRQVTVRTLEPIDDEEVNYLRLDCRQLESEDASFTASEYDSLAGSYCLDDNCGKVSLLADRHVTDLITVLQELPRAACRTLP